MCLLSTCAACGNDDPSCPSWAALVGDVLGECSGSGSAASNIRNKCPCTCYGKCLEFTFYGGEYLQPMGAYTALGN